MTTGQACPHRLNLTAAIFLSSHHQDLPLGPQQDDKAANGWTREPDRRRQLTAARPASTTTNKRPRRAVPGRDPRAPQKALLTTHSTTRSDLSMDHLRHTADQQALHRRQNHPAKTDYTRLHQGDAEMGYQTCQRPTRRRETTTEGAHRRARRRQNRPNQHLTRTTLKGKGTS